MKKPWEEDWIAGDDGQISRIDRDGGYRMIGEVDEERAILIAAAPELVRVLLAIEWSGSVDYPDRCPSCRGAKPSGRPFSGHAPTCPLDAALRKAGVRG